MRTIGIVIMIIGLLITLVTGFSFITREKVLDVGPLEVTKDQKNELAWSPIVGVITILAGGGVLLLGMKRA